MRDVSYIPLGLICTRTSVLRNRRIITIERYNFYVTWAWFIIISSYRIRLNIQISECGFEGSGHPNMSEIVIVIAISMNKNIFN